MSNVTTLPTKGRTLLSGAGRILGTPYSQAVGLEGTRMEFDDINPVPTGGIFLKRSGRRKICLLVRNTSGVTLERRRIVKWASGFRNRRVDGYCSVDFEEVAGVVDEQLGADGCPNHDLFWLEVHGPCLVKSGLTGNALNVITANQPLLALTAVTSQSTTGGRFQPMASSTGMTQVITQLLNYIGFAMSAQTTNNTNADLLVDLKVLK